MENYQNDGEQEALDDHFYTVQEPSRRSVLGEASEQQKSLISLGWCLLVAGVVLLILNTLETVAPLTFMPSFWWMNRNMWWILSFVAAIVGAFLLVSNLREEEPSADPR